MQGRADSLPPLELFRAKRYAGSQSKGAHYPGPEATCPTATPGPLPGTKRRHHFADLGKAPRHAGSNSLLQGPKQLRPTRRLRRPGCGRHGRGRGAARSAYQHEALVNLPCKRVQRDEIRALVGAKDKDVPSEKKGTFGVGSVYLDRHLPRQQAVPLMWSAGT